MKMGMNDPRGKNWSDDKSKFGYKMLEKMGWEDGKGLGANEDGRTDHVKVSKKSDAGGIGTQKDTTGKAWIENTFQYSALLANLNKVYNGTEKEESSADSSSEKDEKETTVSVSSPTQAAGGLRSETVRARWSYRRILREKGTVYSTDALSCILGGAAPTKPVEEKCEVKEESTQPKDNHNSGTMITNSMNMNDYFKLKMAEMENRKRKREEGVVTPEVTRSEEPAETVETKTQEQSEEPPKKKKKTSKKNKKSKKEKKAKKEKKKSKKKKGKKTKKIKTD
eukprot:TRINITY_DN1208_c0_g1_i1.p1 TRINITY_DN1208_c0_g1~~TRINITY_DN1208_c0_g1_i1.p1  ORF type:complete len:281 (+),score=98.78 TRINITY_DN1208_c0_g1_i1:129-971(+)